MRPSRNPRAGSRQSLSPPADGLPSARPSHPSKFGVARANAVLSAALPSIIFQGRKPSPRLSALPNTPGRSLSPVADRKPPPRPAVQQLDLKPLPQDDLCKARPASSKGSGAGRPFVPWCKK